MNQDYEVLRELARAYVEIAADPINSERRRLHTSVNDNRQIRPVVLLAEIPWHEFATEPELTLVCADPELRQVESFLRKNLYQWQHFAGDIIVSPHFPLHKIIHSTGIGITVDEEILRGHHDSTIMSHMYRDQLGDDATLDSLHSPTITYNETQTLRLQDKLQDALGGVLAVELEGHELHAITWDEISRYRGVEPLLISLVDEPEFVHRMVQKLTDIYLDTVRQYEALGLFQAQQISIHCTSALTSDLPQKKYNGKARAVDVWGRGAAQILASVSPDMHKEFDIDYMCKAMAPFGLVYYGCCEPLDTKIHIVEKLPNLRKISLTPWADFNVACERIAGRFVVAAKVNPANVSGSTVDEGILRQEIGGILNACRSNGCSSDIVLKDISTVSGNPQNLSTWARIAMEMVQG